VRITKTIGAVYFVALTLTAGLSQARSCGPEHYFAPHDTDNQNPLKYPHADFLKTRQLAIAGNAADERNLGVYYESGYLVTACKEKAIPWYAKAAAHGDPVAIAWMQRHTEMQGLRKSVECFGDNCLASAMDAVQKTVLQRGADGS
jgi:TPR repeat protein